MSGRRFADSFHDALAILDEHGDAAGALGAAGVKLTPAEHAEFAAQILPRLRTLTLPDLVAVTWQASRLANATGAPAYAEPAVPYTPRGEVEFMPD